MKKAIIIFLIILSFLVGYIAGKEKNDSLAVKLRETANEVENSNIENKSDIAERIEAISAEIQETTCTK